MLWLQKLGKKWGGSREKTCKPPTGKPKAESKPWKLAFGWTLAGWMGVHSEQSQGLTQWHTHHRTHWVRKSCCPAPTRHSSRISHLNVLDLWLGGLAWQLWGQEGIQARNQRSAVNAVLVQVAAWSMDDGQAGRGSSEVDIEGLQNASAAERAVAIVVWGW